MQTLRYSVRINAPAHTVRATVLDEASYREWTRGMIGIIIENRPDEFVCVEYSGQIVDGVDDTTSEAARQLAGSREAYSFAGSTGVTAAS